MNAERLVDRLLASGPVTRMSRRGHDLVVLAYHGVNDQAQFARHLDQLVAEHRPVDLADVLAALDGAPLPPGAVLITFDDGERTVLTAGLPELEARGLPAVLFDVPGVLDSSASFWWVEAETLLAAGRTSHLIPDRVAGSGPPGVIRYLKTVSAERMDAILDELRSGADPVETQQLTAHDLIELDQRGVRVENHSWSHPLLDLCSQERIDQEIDLAHDRLTEILDRPPTAFAYPNGNLDHRVTSALVERGYSGGFLFDHATVALPVDDRMRVSRVRVNSTTSDDRFAAVVSGAHPTLHRLRGGA